MYYLTKNIFYSDIVFVTYFVNLQDLRNRICVFEKKTIDHDIDELKTYGRADILTMLSWILVSTSWLRFDFKFIIGHLL